jgi:hypothetical protein
MVTPPEPPPLAPPAPPAPRRRLLQKLADTVREVGSDLSSIGKACTCGDPRHHGPCPRHGKLY